jgi:predicted nucleotidyltransferase
MDELRATGLEFTETLADALGDRLRSVVLHGSVARGEAVPGVSDVNLLVLVDAVDAGLLRTLAPHARGWMEEKRSLPLVLTWDEWRRASDAFAVETADMLDAREVLHGDDPLEGASVRPRHLRVQAERELRGKLIHLREGTLASADRPVELGRLVLTALPSVATYLRAALRLAGDPAPADTPAVLRQGTALVGADVDPLHELWTLRAKRKVPEVEVDDPRVVAVHRVLERTADHVDTLSGDTP